eukprot:5513634-Amphidinium_carterae.2
MSRRPDKDAAGSTLVEQDGRLRQRYLQLDGISHIGILVLPALTEGLVVRPSCSECVRYKVLDGKAGICTLVSA